MFKHRRGFVNRSYCSQVSIAKYISISLALMYGVTPVLVDNFGLSEIKWAVKNFIFSLALSVFILFLPVTSRSSWVGSKIEPIKIRPWFYWTVFILSIPVFYLFPWPVEANPIGVSFAAILRALWLFIAFSCVNSGETDKLKTIILTVLLMYIDQSRTYFMLGILVIAVSSKYKRQFVAYGVFLSVLLASFRSGLSFSAGAFDFLLFGIIGEASLATISVGQIFASSEFQMDSTLHLIHTFLQPLFLPFELLAAKIFDVNITSQASYLERLVQQGLGETLSPMGGWYIVAEFIYYGWLGIPIMLGYVLLTWKVTAAIFNTDRFPFGSFIFFVCIKSNPFVYWKFLFYIFTFFYLARTFNKISFVKKYSGIFPVPLYVK